jgi:hypothetical protein
MVNDIASSMVGSSMWIMMSSVATASCPSPTSFERCASSCDEDDDINNIAYDLANLGGALSMQWSVGPPLNMVKKWMGGPHWSRWVNGEEGIQAMVEGEIRSGAACDGRRWGGAR